MKNNTSFYGKQHVVLRRTTRRFRKHFLFDWEDPKLGIRFEKLKINSYFCQTQPQDKKEM